MSDTVIPTTDDLKTTRANGQKDAVPHDDLDPFQGHVCARIRDLRKRKGWTLEQLASLSGVSRSMLSQIERGNANPTLAVAYRIAQAFGMTIGALVDQQETPSQIEVIRADDPTFWFRHDEHCRIRTLSPLHLEKDVEFYQLRLAQGKRLESAPHYEGTREFLAVEKGIIQLEAGLETQKLQRGDSAHYPADVEHSIENIGRGEALVFLVDIYGRTI